jgi:hypothetical protein
MPSRDRVVKSLRMCHFGAGRSKSPSYLLTPKSLPRTLVEQVRSELGNGI